MPYIVSPGEAEAQCAALEENGLCDAVATDDSDAFLFGCSRLFRHLFGKHQIEEYTIRDIKQALGLSREELISFAYFLEGDYYSGIKGVGPKRAMEIVKLFPNGLNGLKKFALWLCSEPVLDEEDAEHANLVCYLSYSMIVLEKSFEKV